jgi:hypothetical protein
MFWSENASATRNAAPTRPEVKIAARRGASSTAAPSRPNANLVRSDSDGSNDDDGSFREGGSTVNPARAGPASAAVTASIPPRGSAMGPPTTTPTGGPAGVSSIGSMPSLSFNGAALPRADSTVYTAPPTVWAANTRGQQSVITEAQHQYMEPWRSIVRGMFFSAVVTSVVCVGYRMLPPARNLFTQQCFEFSRWAGDPLAQARITASRASTRGVAVASWEVIRVFWTRCPASRAVVVALAPEAIYRYGNWLLDHSAYVARTLREAMRPTQSPLRRRRRWQHAAVELTCLAAGAGAGAAVVAATYAVATKTPIEHFLSDLQSFVAREGGSAAAVKLADALRAEHGRRHPLTISLTWALPLVPHVYPDVTASAAWYLSRSLNGIRRLLWGTWRGLVAMRTNLTLSANDEDDTAESAVP